MQYLLHFIITLLHFQSDNKITDLKVVKSSSVHSLLYSFVFVVVVVLCYFVYKYSIFFLNLILEYVSEDCRPMVGSYLY